MVREDEIPSHMRTESEHKRQELIGNYHHSIRIKTDKSVVVLMTKGCHIFIVISESIHTYIKLPSID